MFGALFVILTGGYLDNPQHIIKKIYIAEGNPVSTALIVLDIQRDFIGDQARMPVAEHHVSPMIENINMIIEKSTKVIPIVYVGNEFEKKQFIANWFRNNAALKGSLGAKLDKRLKIVNDLYFSKNQGNALSNLKLVNYFKDNRIEHLIIVGLFAEGCVAATARGAMRRNFKVTVIRDAVAGANDKKREQSLRKLATSGVSVIDSSELLLTNGDL